MRVGETSPNNRVSKLSLLLTFLPIVIKVYLLFSLPFEVKTMKSKIDYKEILKLIDLLEERNLLAFELEIEGLKIKISRGQSPSIIPESPAPSSPPTESDANPVTVEPGSTENKNNLHYITSPMVGTFYRAPDPSSPPFVEIGEDVHKNQTLCIIEAMKLMNEIESDIDGVLEDIYIQNGKPVEYGKKLFAIKPEK
jgi:acetyl-CoA carboxylase biotin carboxyl carrier protein